MRDSVKDLATIKSLLDLLMGDTTEKHLIILFKNISRSVPELSETLNPIITTMEKDERR